MRLETIINGDTVWAIYPATLNAAIAAISKDAQSLEVPSVSAKEEFDGARAYITGKSIELFDDNSTMGRHGRVAVLPIQGAIRPKPAFSFFSFGRGSANLLSLARELKRAVEDDTIDHIILDIDSPGGLVNGTDEFAQLVKEAARKKNVIAFGQSQVASSAYWIASQTNEIVAAPTAELGSIGVMAVYTDWSKYDERVGIQEIVFRSSQSPNKNRDLTTDAGAELFQARLDAQAEVFINAVAEGRKRSAAAVVEDFGQGDLSVGEQAVAVGLADRLGSFDQLLSELSTPQTGIVNMSNQVNTSALVPGALYRASADGQITSQIQLTAELVKELAPAVAEALSAEGKEAGVTEGRAAGAKEARETIQAIEKQFDKPGVRAVVDEMKYADDVTPEKVAMEIYQRAEKGDLDYSAALDDDTPDSLSSETPSDDDAATQAANAFDDENIKELNAGR